MDLEYILEELKPLDYKKETKRVTLLFNKNIIIFLREWEDNKLMWHVFKDNQSINVGVDEEEKIISLLKIYVNEK